MFDIYILCYWGLSQHTQNGRKEHSNSEQQIVDHKKGFPMWDLNQHLAQ